MNKEEMERTKQSYESEIQQLKYICQNKNNQLQQYKQQIDELKQWFEEMDDITDGYDLNSDYFTVRDFKEYNKQVLSKLKEHDKE